jgi:hypothetical protein
MSTLTLTSLIRQHVPELLGAKALQPPGGLTSQYALSSNFRLRWLSVFWVGLSLPNAFGRGSADGFGDVISSSPTG